MINKGLAIFHEKISASQRNLFICFALIFTIAWIISLVENQWLWLLLIPVSLIIWFSIIDFKIIFFLLLFFAAPFLGVRMFLNLLSGLDLPFL